jgi:hypothetical protein
MLEFEKMMNLLTLFKSYEYLNLFSKGQIFVFSPEAKLSRETNEMIDKKVHDLPFKICSFEVEGCYITKAYSDLRGHSSASVLIAVEKDSGEIDLYAYCRSDTDGLPDIIRYTPDDSGYVLISSLINELLSNLSKNDHGFFSPRSLIKWKENGVKKQFRISKVIYVGNKHSREIGVHLRNIQWSHAFWVMGHWRTISGLGKDRNGAYCIQGRTWVTNYVKNAELGDPISKIRLVKGS